MDGAVAEPRLSKQLARALGYKGATLHELGRSEEAAVVICDLIRRGGLAPDIEQPSRVLGAVSRWMLEPSHLGLLSPALAARDA